jgi:hypothetical protein
MDPNQLDRRTTALISVAAVSGELRLDEGRNLAKPATLMPGGPVGAVREIEPCFCHREQASFVDGGSCATRHSDGFSSVLAILFFF